MSHVELSHTSLGLAAALLLINGVISVVIGTLGILDVLM